LEEEATIKRYLIVQTEDDRQITRNTENLDTMEFQNDGI
jgi:hypothetical protein